MEGMQMSELRFCVECKHRVPRVKPELCRKYSTLDFVTGESIPGLCWRLRRLGGVCDEIGRGWEQKPLDIPEKRA
jgi:hypothetical protein